MRRRLGCAEPRPDERQLPVRPHYGRDGGLAAADLRPVAARPRGVRSRAQPGTADPTDPPANVAAAPRTMPNALLVAVPGRTHIGVDVGCVRPQIIAFIQAGVPANRASWAACTRALQHEVPAFPPAP